MPRIKRQVADGGVYHIINRGNGQQRVFHKDADYSAFIDLVCQGQHKYSLGFLAYCIMPNHFHLLVKVEKGEDLSSAMQWCMTTHVRRYHRHYHSSGHLWQGRYKSFAIENEEHLLTVIRYIEGNPVRAGMVDSAADWVWSSHRGRCGMEVDRLLSPVPVDLPEDWRGYVDTPLTARELAKVRKRIERQSGAETH